MQGFQKQYLKGLAHDKKPVVLVGQAGVTEAVVAAVKEQLLVHELIKVRLHEPDDKKGMAEELARRTGAELCGLVGHTVILFQPHPEEPRLVLPQREKGPAKAR